MIASSLIGTLLFMLTPSAHSARKTRNEKGCMKVLKVNYCPTQITDYLLQTVAGKDENSFVCMNKFCDEEGDDSQCCKVRDAIKKDVQNPKLTTGFSPDTLAKLRNAVGLAEDAGLGPAEEPSKPIWEIEAENKAAEKEAAAGNASTSDEECMCHGGHRNRGSFLTFEKGNLFSMKGDCTSSMGCNECYRADRSDGGVYGCCLQNANGVAIDCAPEFKKPKFSGERCFCGRGGSTLKSTLFEQGAKHCFPTTDCKICKAGCSSR